jgi:hypothetical protein
MIVTAEMQEPMKDQLADLALKVQPMFGRLKRRTFHGDHYVAHVKPVQALDGSGLGRKRKHVRGYGPSTEATVETSDSPIRGKYDCRTFPSRANLVESGFREPGPTGSINFAEPLPIKDLNHNQRV